MGLSRRQFTKQFKMAAVRRLEQGISIAEVARALEVNPNVLHRWRREVRQGQKIDLQDLLTDLPLQLRDPSFRPALLSIAWKRVARTGCLQRIEEQRMLQALTGNPRS